MELKFQVKAIIDKPIPEVFAGIYDPDKLSQYFTTGGASAPLNEGTTVTWDFADFPGAFPVVVKKMVRNSLIVIEWDSNEKGRKNLVEFKFGDLKNGRTEVSVSETGWRENQKSLDASYLNCQGWMHMLCSLKAYLEYGINLRKDFFK
ncbi:MAG: ATPase [Caldithrix sp. RBG_13_44_9]|nr:MAG: ATPase [Caldithrix sp. RBG_13_44_9]